MVVPVNCFRVQVRINIWSRTSLVGFSEEYAGSDVRISLEYCDSAEILPGRDVGPCRCMNAGPKKRTLVSGIAQRGCHWCTQQQIRATWRAGSSPNKLYSDNQPNIYTQVQTSLNTKHSLQSPLSHVALNAYFSHGHTRPGWP